MPADHYAVSLANAHVSTLTDLSLRLRLLNPAPAGSHIRVTFPPEVKLTDASQSQTYLTSVLQQGRISGRMEFRLEASAGAIKDTVVITDAMPSYRDAGSSINLKFQKIQTPVSSAETSNFKFQKLGFWQNDDDADDDRDDADDENDFNNNSHTDVQGL